MLALLLAGYFAQQYLPPPKPKVVGIDLGDVFRRLSFHFCYFLIRCYDVVFGIQNIILLPECSRTPV